MITLNTRPKLMIGIVAFAIVYVITGILGNYLAVPPGYATIFWPPSGVAMAAVYLFGYPMAIGVFIGALIVNAMNTTDFFVLEQLSLTLSSASVISFGAALQAVIGAFLVRKYVGPKTKLESLDKIFNFSFLAGPISCLVSSSIGVCALLFIKSLPFLAASMTWVSWYIGDVLGVLVFSPVLILLLSDQNISSRRRLYTILPLLFIFALVIFSFFYIKQADRDAQEYEFEINAQLVKKELDYKIKDHFQELESMRALYDSSDKVDQREFNTFADSMGESARKGGIAYAPIIYRGNEDTFNEFLINEGIVDFKIRYMDAATNHNQICEPYCMPLLFVYPINVYNKVVGIDLIGEQNRANAIAQALNNQRMNISAPVLLASSKKLGFISFLPIFKKNAEDVPVTEKQIEGFVLNGISYELLFKDVLEKWAFKGIHLEVKDMLSEKIVYSGNADGVINEDFQIVFQESVGGRKWQFCFSLNAEYILANVNWNIWFALSSSLLFTFLASVFLLAVTGQTASIEAIVDDKTKQLSDSNRFMKVIMDSVPDLVFVKNEDHVIIQGNQAYLEIFSPDKRENIIGSTGFENQPDDEVEIFKEKDQQAMDVGYFETEEKVSNYKGETKDFFTKKIRFETEDGKPYLLGIARDITSEKQMLEHLRESEQRFRASLENAPIGMSLVGIDGNWIIFNQALLDMLGYTKKQFEKKSLDSLTHPDDLDKDKEQIKQLLNGEIKGYSVEKRYVKKDGGIIWILLTLALVRDESDQPIYYVANSLDITERRKIMNELQRSNEELEQFAYVASHDLKAPLRHVSLSAGFLADQYEGQLDENADELINIMTRSTERMHDMIESLLDYSRVGQKSSEDIEKIQLNEIVSDTKESLQAMISETNASINTRGLKISFNANRFLMMQLFQNLIQNAIKYRKDTVDPKIQITAKSDSNFIEISVADNGIGIDEKHAKKIFDVFQRLHGEGQYDGTGIGLAICKRIIETHNGELWLDTKYKNGCKFVFKIPVL